MSRALLKSGLGVALAATATDRLLGRITGARALPLVVGYHRVVESMALDPRTATPAMAVTVQTFVKHLEWIGRRYRFVSLEDVGARMSAGVSGAPVAAVTFDDGYADVYHHALPVLTRMGIPAAVFVITGAIGSTALRMHDRLHLLLSRDWPRARALLGALEPYRAEVLAAGTPFEAMRAFLSTRPAHALDRLITLLEEQTGPAGDAPESLRPLDWDMVLGMHRAGVTIGSHTCDHPVLTNEEPALITEELRRSREILQRRLNAPVRHLAYPDGAFDDAIAAAAADAGYHFAYTTCRHRDTVHPMLSVPRRFLWENSCLDAAGRFSPAVMGCLTNGVYDLASSCRRVHRAALARPVFPTAPARRSAV